jgi:hypothetical protein
VRQNNKSGIFKDKATSVEKKSSTSGTIVINLREAAQ